GGGHVVPDREAPHSSPCGADRAGYAAGERADPPGPAAWVLRGHDGRPAPAPAHRAAAAPDAAGVHAYAQLFAERGVRHDRPAHARLLSRAVRRRAGAAGTAAAARGCRAPPRRNPVIAATAYHEEACAAVIRSSSCTTSR